MSTPTADSSVIDPGLEGRQRPRTRSPLVRLSLVIALTTAALGTFLVVRGSGRPTADREPGVVASGRTDAPTAGADSAGRAAPSLAPARESARVAATPSSGAARDSSEEPLRRLRTSGPSNEPWTADAERALKKLLAASEETNPGATGIELHDVSCFQDGCVASAIFANEAVLAAKGQALPHSEEFMRWRGSKALSPPFRDKDGHIVAHLIFYRPRS